MATPKKSPNDRHRADGGVSYATRGATPTEAQYGAFDRIFGFFNERLFAGRLPAVMLTFNRRNKTRGYFSAERWAGDGGTLGEIALNPDHLRERTPKENFSTIVHEMVHLWQHACGKPSRTGYHNIEWADRMEGVGLKPSDTGQPGGRRVGQRVTHYIVDGGAFDRAFAEMPTDWLLPFTSAPLGDGASAKKANRSKTAFVCPGCGVKAWGKPELAIACVDCDANMEVASP
jgi:predicted SprT family Zn-dependent metalloprotease